MLVKNGSFSFRGMVVLLGLLSFLLVFCMFSTNYANASIEKSYSGSFSTAWQKVATSGNGRLIYGFDTESLDEDYAWAYHSTTSHRAAVKQGTDTLNMGPSVSKGNVSKKEIWHGWASNSVTRYYKNTW